MAAYLREREERWRSLVGSAVEASDSPVEAVTAPFIALRTWNQANARGCAFINALAELPDPSHPAHLIAANQKIWLLDTFTKLATAAHCSTPALLGTQLLVLHEGALATQPFPFETLAVSTDLARSLVLAATPPPTG